MTIKKRGLGRGLSDLGLNELLTSIKPIDALKSATELQQIPLETIQSGRYQPRRGFETSGLEELAQSIRAQGVIQPIVVRSIAPNRYEIVAGERRWRAAKIAELTEIPALIRVVSDETALAVALIENIQRENLNAIEEAIALQRLYQEFSLTHQQIASMVGKSRTTVSNLLRLLSLPMSIKQMVEKGQLEMGHARALLALEENKQRQAAEQIVLKNLSVREAELYIRRLLTLQAYSQPVEKDQVITALEQRLSAGFGMKVTIKAKDRKQGKLIIHYADPDQLHVILARLDTK